MTRTTDSRPGSTAPANTAGGGASLRVVLAAGLALGLAPAAPGSLGATTARGVLSVGATVLARADIRLASVPEAIEISSADLARGFIDIAEPARLVVRNTSAVGFELEVQPVSPLFTAVEIRGSGADVAFDAAGGAIAQRGRRGAELPVVLGFRFTLAPGLAPGRYPWPLAFSVRPLALTQ